MSISRQLGSTSGWGLLIAMLASAPHATAQERSVHATRAEFIKALKKLDTEPVEGTDKEIILQVVGKPDDIRHEGDEDGTLWYLVKEIWCYGTDKRLGCATLGRIYFDQEDNLLQITGESGFPPDPEVISEAELRRLLRIVHEAPGGGNYDPFKMVGVVNALQAEGEDKTFLAIKEYLRITNDPYDLARDRMMYLAQLLQELPADPGYFAESTAGLGSPNPLLPSDRKLLPRYPLWIYEDIPFLVGGFDLAGDPGPLEPKVFGLFKYAFRKQPLEPTDNPLALLKLIDTLPELNYKIEGSPGLTEKVRNLKGAVLSQLLDRFEPNGRPLAETYLPQSVRYDKLMKMKLRWNPKTSDYDKID